MKNHYITATIELLHSGKEPAAVLGGLKKTLEARGHQALYPSILRGVERLLHAKNSQSAILAVAREKDVDTFKAAITAASKELDVADAPEVVVDDTLIGGFVLQTGTTRLDQSYKTKLVSLYRSLIK